MVLGHDPLVYPEHMPLAPVHRLQVRRLRQLPENPKRNQGSSRDPGAPQQPENERSLGTTGGNEPEGIDEGSAGEHDGEGAPLGGELRGKIRRVFGQGHREVLLGVEDEQVPLRRGGGGGGGAVGGHRGGGEEDGGRARGGEEAGAGPEVPDRDEGRRRRATAGEEGRQGGRCGGGDGDGHGGGHVLYAGCGASGGGDRWMVRLAAFCTVQIDPENKQKIA